jgi:two-component system, LuxR family, response regulator DctR
MNTTPPLRDATVYIVDDDASVREALAWMLRTRRLNNESFDSADLFLHEIETHFAKLPSSLPIQSSPLSSPSFAYAVKHPACLLLDVRMPGTSGLALFEQLTQFQLLETLPVIFLTGHADLPTAVDAVKRGAFDFYEKPFSNNALVDRIQEALAHSAMAVAAHKLKTELAQKIGELTEREQAVMRCVVAGQPNKLIADELAISVRTVEVHRARLFEKMAVKSAVELANLLR